MKQVTTTINGKQFLIYTLGARDGFKIAAKIKKLLLPTIGGGFDAMRDKRDPEFSDPAYHFSKVAQLFVDRFDEDEVLAIIEKLLNGFGVGGQQQDFDSYFDANYGELVEVITFALKENFSSFFTKTGMNLLTKGLGMVVQMQDQTENGNHTFDK